MTDHNKERLNELLELKESRLHELEKQQAVQGISTPPHINIEIENIRRDIVILRDTLYTGVTSSRQSRSTKVAPPQRKNISLLWLLIVLFLILIVVSVVAYVSRLNTSIAQLSATNTIYETNSTTLPTELQTSPFPSTTPSTSEKLLATIANTPRVISINQTIQAKESKEVSLTLQTIEMFPDGRMRWNFLLTNSSPENYDLSLSYTSIYLSDEKGNKYSLQADSNGTTFDQKHTISLPGG